MAATSPEAAALTQQIVAKGEAIRVLKAEAAGKEAVAAAVSELLALKAQFKAATGEDYGPPPSASGKKKSKSKELPKEEAATSTKEEGKKSKKELNKERKKAAKAALKAGEPVPAEVTKAVAVVGAGADAPAAEAPQQEKKKKKAGKSEGASVVKKASAVAVSSVPMGCVLPVPTAEDEGTVTFFTSPSSSNDALPLAAYVVAVLTKQAAAFRHHASGDAAAGATVEPTLLFTNGDVVSGDFAVARYLCRVSPRVGGALMGTSSKAESDAVSVSQVDAWLDFALSRFPARATASEPRVANGLAMLNVALRSRTFLVGHALSLADIGVWARLEALALPAIDAAQLPHVARWYAHLQSQHVFGDAANALRALPVIAAAKNGNNSNNKGNKGKSAGTAGDKGTKSSSSGSCPPLKGAVVGEVVTRFPPEPSGFLHIGHLKACLLNDYYAREYKGKLIVRFDDTNPSKEKDEFEQSILADLKRLDIVPSQVTYTSDSFPKIMELARQMLREGLAYMDNTPQEQMREERMNGIPSARRDSPAEENLALFEKMVEGHADAEGFCMRGKIDMQAKNKTLRDPVFFRANLTPHHRTGTKYRAYPTYDLACPIVDSLEGVTHALRTTEYNDRDEQYQWVLTALRLRPVRIHAFARMNFVHSVLSKRKLQWFVDQGHVTGWNDPRFPTIQGVLRRGVQKTALRDFIVSQGASRRITDMEWDKFWTTNKRVLDPMASRYFAVSKDNAVPLHLTNVTPGTIVGLPIARHPKDPSKGNKIMRFTSELLVERDDATLFVEGEEVTLMRHGNIIVRKVIKDPTDGHVIRVEAENHPEGDFKKTKLKITWLAAQPDLVDCVLVEFDHLISKPKLEENDSFQDHLTPVTRAEMFALGDQELRNAQRNDVVQLERRGFFRVDEPYISKDKPLVLFMVPDGKAKAMSALSTNLAHR